MSRKSDLDRILPEADIQQVETEGDLYKVTRSRGDLPDENILVRFVSPEQDQHTLLEIDNKQLEVLFYDEEVNRWNIQLIWALTMGEELEDDIETDFVQDKRFALRRSVDVADLREFLAPLKVVEEEIGEIETEFNRSDLIQNIIDADLEFLFQKEETSREERLDMLISDQPDANEIPDIHSSNNYDGRIHEIDFGTEFRPTASNRSLETSQFTLLEGPNGSGKSSILDCAALGMVGQIKNGEARSRSYEDLYVSLINDNGEIKELSNEPHAVADRIANWFGYRPKRNADRHHEFYRVNYHEAGVTTRIIESGSNQNLEQTIRRFIYGEQLWEAKDEKEKILSLAENRIEEIENHLTELQSDFYTSEKEIEQVKKTYSKAYTVAKDLSPATQELLDYPEIEEQESRDLTETVETNWVESWREWEERFQRLRKSLDALYDTKEEPETVSAIHTAFKNEADELDGTIDHLEEIQELKTVQKNITQFIEKFERDPLNKLSASTAFIAAILSANNVELDHLQLVRRAVNELDESIKANSVSDFTTNLRLRLSSRQEELENRKQELEEISDIEQRRRDIHDDVQKLTEEYLSVTESVEYCPACYTEQTKNTLENRRKPQDLFNEETSVPKTVSQELRLMSDALEVLNHSDWANIQYNIESRFDDLCGMQELKRIFQLSAEISSFEDFPVMSSEELSQFAEAIRIPDLDLFRSSIVEILNESENLILDDIYLESQFVTQYDPEKDDLQVVLSNLSERQELLTAGCDLLEAHVPDSKWTLQIDIERDHPIIKQTLDDAYDSPNLTNTLEELQDEVQKYRNEINKNQAKKVALEDGIDRLEETFNRAGGDAAFTELVDQHMSVIETLFQTFQRPYEFDSIKLKDGTVKVTRRGNQTSDPVHKMSSGQRAALALAIFITNNLAHPHAPPVILLDEPFAHLDDINTVSFFNLLISAMTEFDRQIIFATANRDIAELLDRKIGDTSEFDRIPLQG